MAIFSNGQTFIAENELCPGHNGSRDKLRRYDDLTLMSFKVHSNYLVILSINVHYCIHSDKHCSRDRIHIQLIA